VVAVAALVAGKLYVLLLAVQLQLEIYFEYFAKLRHENLPRLFLLGVVAELYATIFVARIVFFHLHSVSKLFACCCCSLLTVEPLVVQAVLISIPLVGERQGRRSYYCRALHPLVDSHVFQVDENAFGLSN
jgi:hypothetical protein